MMVCKTHLNLLEQPEQHYHNENVEKAEPARRNREAKWFYMRLQNPWSVFFPDLHSKAAQLEHNFYHPQNDDSLSIFKSNFITIAPIFLS